MSFDWYPWYVQTYRKNTMHLGLAEDGAYRRLIDEYMMTRAPLPDNDDALARIVGVSRETWLAVAPKVRPYFEASNGKLVHSRCEEELLAQAKQTHRKAMAGALGAEARWKDHRKNKSNGNGLWQPHSSRMADPMANDGTLQDIRKKEGEAGSRATPSARSPALQSQASPELKSLVANRGWKT